MEQAPLIDSALKVIFFDDDIENGQHPEMAHPGIDLDVSLDWAVTDLARQNISVTCELVEAAKAINKLRQSKSIKYLVPDEVLGHLKRTIQIFVGYKRKYDELLDQTEQEARQRAAAQRVSNVFWPRGARQAPG